MLGGDGFNIEAYCMSCRRFVCSKWGRTKFTKCSRFMSMIYLVVWASVYLFSKLSIYLPQALCVGVFYSASCLFIYK